MAGFRHGRRVGESGDHPHRYGERRILFVGHHAGEAPNPASGQTERNGLSILDVTDPVAPQLLAHDVGLHAKLCLVLQMLERAAAASLGVRTRRPAAARRGVDQFDEIRARPSLAPLGHAHAHRLVGGGAMHEDGDARRQTADARAACGDAADADHRFLTALSASHGTSTRCGRCRRCDRRPVRVRPSAGATQRPILSDAPDEMLEPEGSVPHENDPRS